MMEGTQQLDLKGPFHQLQFTNYFKQYLCSLWVDPNKGADLVPVEASEFISRDSVVKPKTFLLLRPHFLRIPNKW